MARLVHWLGADMATQTELVFFVSLVPADFTVPSFAGSDLWGQSPQTQELRKAFDGWRSSLTTDELHYYRRVYNKHDGRFDSHFGCSINARRAAEQRAARIARGECGNGCFNGWIRHMGSDYPCGSCNH